MHPHADPEFDAILPSIAGPDGRFGHREHINLAFYAVRRYGMPDASATVCAWIQQLTVYKHAPQKYHHTVSRAWVEIVAHHVAADQERAYEHRASHNPAHQDRADRDRADFWAFAERWPALLDKRLLVRHYRSATLASAEARHGWVEPDLLPFPWAGSA